MDETLVTLVLMCAMTIKRENIGSGHGPRYRSAFFWRVVMAGLVKGTPHFLCDGGRRGMAKLTLVALLSAVPLWILRSLLFEVIFDGVHYALHRLSHCSRWLCRFHKIHHTFSAPTVWTTYHMHPIDLVLSYSVPFWVASRVVPWGTWELALVTVHLTHIEIAGHAGKRMFPISSFAQCAWLPRPFNMQLYTEDHDLLHQLSNCNYAKRLTLWDRLFGTYSRSPALP